MKVHIFVVYLQVGESMNFIRPIGARRKCAESPENGGLTGSRRAADDCTSCELSTRYGHFIELYESP